MSRIARTPDPPYYVVIFTSIRKEGDLGYAHMAERLLGLAAEMSGFLGIESAREDIGLTVSYWKDLKSIKNWKSNTEHQTAQQLGKEKWYSEYKVRIAKVESDYAFR